MYKINFLRTKALFGGLDDKHLEKVASLLKEEHFSKGTVIIKEADKGDKMYMIAKGNVEILKYNTKLKEQEQIATLSEGDSFGEMELIDIQPRCATVKAISDVECVSLSNFNLLELSLHDLEAFSLILINIARIISRKLRKADNKLVSLLHQ